ncbi:hypothetical protein PV326_013774 [Microctonus aethiopoides]|nr:hypothetical protein PV326_013774 [Microctonus aethiopoides]
MATEQQRDEIVALESIFNNEEFSYSENNGQYYYTLKVFISLPIGYYFTYKDTRNPDELVEKVPICHLPPLSLFITLPNDYPSISPPEFTLCCSWLRYSLVKKLCKKLDDLWIDNQGQEILYIWAEFLKNEILEFLGIENDLNIEYAYTCYKMRLEKNQDCNVQSNSSKPCLSVQIADNSCLGAMKSKKYLSKQKLSYKKNPKNKMKDTRDPRAIIDRHMNQNPVQMLNDYNEKRMEIEFKKNFYTCKICFADKSGESCTQFKPCLHVFCKECISGYFEVKIKDGAVQNINCPEEKCTSEALNGQIKDLVSPELFSKYDSTLLNATLATMLDIVHCPRRQCQYPVSKEPNEKMARCPACSYVFCLLCKMVYHGIEPCKLSSANKQELVNTYSEASPEVKLQLEKRYGKQQLTVLVENTMSENWIHNNSHNCPHCNAAIEKSDGCNKMTCGRCNTFFCWTCGVRLDHNNPYVHYRSPDSKCFNKLYLGLIDEEDDDYEDEDEAFDYVYYDEDDEDFLIDFGQQ